MFTGIVQALGSVERIEPQGGDMRLVINSGELDLDACHPGDSISVNGVCLTAVDLSEAQFSADVSNETLSKTSLGALEAAAAVNLEKALTLQTPLGGHLVSGHVDGLASLIESQEDARSIRYRFELPAELQHYVAEKGSITIDGVSLTVNRVEQNRFDVNIVPHTRDRTLFQHYRQGDRVNIEVDLIARYLERLIEGKASQQQLSDKRLMETLIKSGFVES